MSDNYPAAAMRHYRDAVILQENGRLDNAMCHYAFCAECFVKVLYDNVCHTGGRGLGHKIEQAYASLVDFYSFICMRDAKTEIMLGNDALPDCLFKNHPARRYWDDITYTEEDVQEVKALTERMMQELVMQLIDGRIFLNDEV